MIEDLSSEFVKNGTFAITVTLDDSKDTMSYTVMLTISLPGEEPLIEDEEVLEEALEEEAAAEADPTVAGVPKSESPAPSGTPSHDDDKKRDVDEPVIIEDIPTNITDVSVNGLVTITMERPIVVPANYTNLSTSIIDVWYLCNSEEPKALYQNFTFNLTYITTTSIQVELYFSDPLYVSADSLYRDEILIRMNKTFFGISDSSS